MKVNDILKYLENRFPYELAADFDYNKIGLVVGNENENVKGVLCSLDLTHNVINEAIKNNCNLIFIHHPITFTPLTKILQNDEKGSLIISLIKNNISLIVMHTNMDLGKDGVADTLCQLFSLKNSNYGINQKDEYLRYGDIEPITLRELAHKTKQILNVDGVKVIGDLSKTIDKIAILGGSGGNEYYIDQAIKNDCKCYITGEIKHHIGLYANYKEICLIEVNHGIEKVVFNKIANDIAIEFNIKVIISEEDSNLFKYM